MAELRQHLYYEFDYDKCLIHSGFCSCKAKDLVNAVFRHTLPDRDRYRWIRTKGELRIRLAKPISEHYIVV